MRTVTGAGLAIATALLFTTPLLASPADAAAAGSPRWHSVQVHAPAGGSYGILSGIACPGAADCVAGGEYFTTAKTTVPMLAAESAGRWGRAVTLRLPGNAVGALQAATVAGVACPSRKSCVVVGNYTSKAGSLAGFVATGHGSRWAKARQAAMPKDAVSGPAFLTGVSCTSTRSCTAVGGYTNAAGDQAMAETESAGHWHVVAIRPPSNAGADPDAHLAAVSCTSSGDCVAIGAYTTKAFDEEGLAVIERHGRWARGTAIPLPHNAGSTPEAEFYSVSCSRSECAAVGSYTASNVLTGVAATESGGHWRRGVELADLPANWVSNEPSGLEAVSCTKSECVAVGFYNDKAKGLAIMATTETGHTWHRAVQLGLPAHAAQAEHQLAELFGVACGGHDDCTAVGTYTTTSQIPEAVAARN